MDISEAEGKYRTLVRALSGYLSVLVGYPGTAGSSLLLAAAVERVPGRVLAVMAKSPVRPLREMEEAAAGAAYIGAEHLFVETGEMENPAFRKNPRDRCYICKKGFLEILAACAKERGFASVVDAETADPTEDSRSRLKACRELGVANPLLSAGLTEFEVRYLARERGVPGWKRPPGGCLATRVPYDTELTVGLLERIAEAEEFIREIGIQSVRVATYPEGLARIEVERDDFDKITGTTAIRKIRERLRELGYRYVTLDLDGIANEGAGI